ncbi:MAG: insulinase family protein [Acidobacteria bacterium]|nr:insulinase family protein [Acidobacteriota bacterium]MBI3658438.1 insulinase family protein [Acidobacteriota bacterium]
MTSMNSAPSDRVKVLERPSANSPLVTFRAVIGSGSARDPQGKNGLNALTALMIGHGGTKNLTYQQVVKTLYPWAATVSPQFDKEVTVFIGEVHRDHLEKFYAILSSLLLEPRFDPEDFKRHQTNLLNALQNTLRGNDDENLGKQALNTFMYANTTYGTPEIGTVQGLKAVTLEDVKAFYKKMYTRGNITIGIAGGYPKDFMSRLPRDFARLPAGKPAAEPDPQPEPIVDHEILLVEKECRSTAISMGFPIQVTRADKDFYALLVANSYLGEHRTFNGALMQHLRGWRGLNYGDYSYIENFMEYPGTVFPRPNIPRRQQFFSIWLRPIEHANRHFGLRNALWELQKLVDKGLSPEDFENTRKFVLNYSKLWVQTMSQRLGYYLDSDFYGTKYYIDRIQEELPKLTVADVNRAIKKHLQYRNVKIAIVTKGAEALKADLMANIKSPVTYASPVSKEIQEEDKLIEVYPLNINQKKIRVLSNTELFEK